LLTGGTGDIYKSEKIFWKSKANPATRYNIVSVKELVGLTKYWNWYKGDLFRLNKGRSTIDFHLDKLLDADIIEKVRVGKEIKYKLKDNGMILNFLIKHKNALSNELIDTMLGWRNNMIGEYLINRAINTIYEIFPHPYHA
jgi:DNA-binding transcriptional ArsR family regulator